MRRPNVLPVVGLAAAPDERAIAASHSLAATIARGLDGQIGGIRGQLDGDPTRSFNGPVPASPSVARAQAAIVTHNSAIAKPTPTVGTALSDNPNLDPYRAMLLYRING